MKDGRGRTLDGSEGRTDGWTLRMARRLARKTDKRDGLYRRSVGGEAGRTERRTMTDRSLTDKPGDRQTVE